MKGILLFVVVVEHKEKRTPLWLKCSIFHATGNDGMETHMVDT